MKPLYLIKRNNFPSTMPLYPTIVLWLLLDRLGAAGWVYGIVGTLLAFGWIGWAIQTYLSRDVDLYDFLRVEWLRQEGIRRMEADRR